MDAKQDSLHRGLEERHINMMALGAAIGVGLFLGSATTIRLAGPAILLSYALGGFAVFLIMRALGEMAIYDPVAGSFSHYAGKYMGPMAGYLTGWTYWFMWIVTCMAEITAVGIYMGMWFPGVPPWMFALAALMVVASANFLAVRAYGELEFWFALIKVVTIVLMIVSGIGMVVFGLGNGGVATGISNVWSHHGFMPNGIHGVMLALPMVMFAYAGVEMIGVTAGEARNPKKSLARAIDSVFWRILIFYIGALFIIMSIYPWDQIGVNGSPFVMTFERLGIPAAAGIINFVVLTAALSSCNSGIFSTARMLYSLALEKQAPAIFARVSHNGTPIYAILVSVVLLMGGVWLNYLVPQEVFTWLTAIATFGALWTWAVILVSQLRFRKMLPRAERALLCSKMPLWPFGSYVALAFLLMIAGIMVYFPDTRIALLVGPAWLALLVAMYYLTGQQEISRLPSATGSLD